MKFIFAHNIPYRQQSYIAINILSALEVDFNSTQDMHDFCFEIRRKEIFVYLYVHYLGYIELSYDILIIVFSRYLIEVQHPNFLSCGEASCT